MQLGKRGKRTDASCDQCSFFRSKSARVPPKCGARRSARAVKQGGSRATFPAFGRRGSSWFRSRRTQCAEQLCRGRGRAAGACRAPPFRPKCRDLLREKTCSLGPQAIRQSRQHCAGGIKETSHFLLLQMCGQFQRRQARSMQNLVGISVPNPAEKAGSVSARFRVWCPCGKRAWFPVNCFHAVWVSAQEAP